MKMTSLNEWISKQEAACRRTGSNGNMPVALKMIQAALGATDRGAAMQAALDEALGEQAARALRVRAKRDAAAGECKAATAAGGSSNADDDGPPAADDDSDRAMFWRQDRMQAQDELARQKNIGLAEGEPEFAPCEDCGHVHNESSCPRCGCDGAGPPRRQSS